MKRRREEVMKEGLGPRNTGREIRARNIEETLKEKEVMIERRRGTEENQVGGRERPLEEDLERYLETDKIDKIHRIDMKDRRKKKIEDIEIEPQVVIDTEEEM